MLPLKATIWGYGINITFFGNNKGTRKSNPTVIKRFTADRNPIWRCKIIVE